MGRINWCLKGTNHTTTDSQLLHEKAPASDQTCSGGLDSNPGEAKLHFLGMFFLMQGLNEETLHFSYRHGKAKGSRRPYPQKGKDLFSVENVAWQNESRKPRKEQVCNIHCVLLLLTNPMLIK